MRSDRKKAIGVLGESRTSEALGASDPRWRRAQQMRALDGTGTGLEVDPKTRRARVKPTRLAQGPANFSGLHTIEGVSALSPATTPSNDDLRDKLNATLEEMHSLRQETSDALEGQQAVIDNLIVALKESGVLEK